MSERTLVVGSGGREHALGQALEKQTDLYFAPGNAGTAEIGTNLPVAANDLEGIARAAEENDCGLVVVGPEQPLVDGIHDILQDYAVFGPTPESARLEGSKAFAVNFMRDNRIPHPDSWVVGTDIFIADGESLIIAKGGENLVIKADGLAGGKGAILPINSQEATTILQRMLSGKLFGEAGKKVVIQERLHGPELSVFVISDGLHYVTLPFSQDHKRLKNNDEGPNTGGMGAYSPVPEDLISPHQQEAIDNIVHHSISGASEDGIPYKGVLYIGMMLAEERDGDPVVIEYNVRFGDPEAQVVLPLLDQAGVDTYDLFRAAAEGKLWPERIEDVYDKLGILVASSALTVCLAAEGYPNSPRKGDVIHGLDQHYPDVVVQHGGTSKEDNQIVTSGGRVLYVTGLGETVDEAAAKAYSAIGQDGVHFDGMQYRTDIGHQARS
jgi:phosphoribosylamine--glycine ligase